jgi:hypothetical protein
VVSALASTLKFTKYMHSPDLRRAYRGPPVMSTLAPLQHAHLLPGLVLLVALVISAFSLTISPSSSPSTAGPRPKVFIIGLSKTGTTSLGDALNRLGYARSGWEDIRSRYLFHSYTHGNVAPLVRHAARFDVLEDIPWSIAYREMAEAFPDAKFVLSLRQDEEKWLGSIDAHTKRRWWVGHELVYGCLSMEGCREGYRERYRRHNAEVVRFFAERGERHRLMSFAIDGKGLLGTDKWGALVGFLGLHGVVERLGGLEKLGGFPLTNSRSEYGNRDPLKIYWVVDRIFYWLERCLSLAF